MSNQQIISKMNYFKEEFCRTIKPIMLKNGFKKLSAYSLEPKGPFTADALLDLIEAITPPIEDLIEDIETCMSKMFKQLGPNSINVIKNTLGVMLNDYKVLLNKLDRIYNTINDDDSDIEYHLQTWLSTGGTYFAVNTSIYFDDTLMFYIDFDKESNKFILKQHPNSDRLVYTFDVGAHLSIEKGLIVEDYHSKEPTPICEYAKLAEEARAYWHEEEKRKCLYEMEVNQRIQNCQKIHLQPFETANLNFTYTCLACGDHYEIFPPYAEMMLENNDFTYTRICRQCAFYGRGGASLSSKEDREKYIEETLPKLTLVDTEDK